MTTNNETRFALVGMYEVREIAKGWTHPIDEHGVAVPLLPFGYRFDEDDEGETMPAPLGEIEIAAYETCSEGTPISPAFPDTPEGKLVLLRWCAANEKLLGKHFVDAEAWAAILFGDGAVTPDGTVVAKG